MNIVAFSLAALAVFVVSVICAAAVVSVTPYRRETGLNILRMTDAIAQVEGGDPHELGGRCCITRAVWDERSPLPYEASRDPEECAEVEQLHVTWLMRQMERADVTPTPALLDEAWHIGVTAALARQHFGQLSERAQRCAALYREMEK